jgi:hypothetical protein
MSFRLTDDQGRADALARRLAEGYASKKNKVDTVLEAVTGPSKKRETEKQRNEETLREEVGTASGRQMGDRLKKKS